MLKWVTNFPNPYSENYFPVAARGESISEALQEDRNLYDKFVKGRPQQTEKYSTEELEKMGMVGLYSEED